MLTKMKLEEYVEDFDDGEDDAAASLRFREKSKLVVFPRDFRKAYHLAFGRVPSVKIAPIVGMAGIGKTTLANEIFQHPNITSFFECRVWVTVGENCRPDHIRRAILRQIDPSANEMPADGDERTVRELLKARRYLIVLDDVWELQLWRDLRNLFDYKRDHSGVLLTTRLQEVALGASYNVVQMSFLNKEESWDLFCDKIFGGRKFCPPKLEKIGKKIAEMCDGLPLTIVTVARILSEVDRTPEEWIKITLNENRNSVFMDAYDHIYDKIHQSYNHLSSSNPEIELCFLYMGVFQQKCEIPTSKLIKLWGAEEFLETNSSKTSAELTVEYLDGLRSRSLVLTVQESSDGGIKTCRLHSVFWYLCNVEASKKLVFTGLSSIQDFDRRDDMENHRRFSIHRNALLTIKDVHDQIASIPLVHSLLCFGPYHQYQVQLYFHSMVLKVIDVLSIHFYEFPKEVLELVDLRYLALTCSGKLPTSISKLKFLEFLIMRRHLSVKSWRVSTYLPMEVWEMKSLKHLQVTGSNLTDPNGDAHLPNLLTLLDVGAPSCTKSVLERIPNLEKLGIQFDISPAGADPPCFDYHISHLQMLRSLKCEIVSPVLIQQEVSTAPRLPDLPLGLKKLSLSGFGYRWEEMSKIASLPNLQVLKLRSFAFRGLKWEARDLEFPALKYLLIEDTDLLDWRASSSSFYRIQRIILKNCYRLQGVPLKIWNNVFAELVDCNPLAAKYKVRHSIPRPHRKVHAHNSWESGVF